METMASTSETGHAKNVANFDDLLAHLVALGATYNPSKPALKLTVLQSLSTSAKTALNTINALLAAYSNAVAAREVSFKPLSKYLTRINNAIKATDTSEQVDEHAKSLVHKIQGVRATPRKTEEEKAQAKAEGKVVREVSSAQTSYDSRLDNLDKLIKLLASIALYAPNEADLKVAALTAMYNDLKAKNAAVVAASVPLSNARIARNDILYKPNTGLVDISVDIKNYIKSLFGATSPQYKQVSKLTFRSVPI
jgi:hypothetical protein